MRKYEIMVIFSSNEDSIEKNKSFISTTLSNNNIKITKEKDIGLIDLSFEINKKNKGHYYLYIVETKNRNFLEMEKAFKLHKDLLRYFIIRQN